MLVVAEDTKPARRQWQRMPRKQPSLQLQCDCALCSKATEQRTGANPIRKVVNMLQVLKGKVEAEGEKEQELFDKYMCYCSNAGGGLAKSIADALN